MGLPEGADAVEVEDLIVEEPFRGESGSTPSLENFGLREAFLLFQGKGMVATAAYGMDGEFGHRLLERAQLGKQGRVAGVFPGKEKDPLAVAAGEGLEGLLHDYSGLAEAGRGLEENRIPGFHAGGEGFAGLRLAIAPGGEGFRYGEPAQPREMRAALLEDGGNRLEVLPEGLKVLVMEGKGLGDAGLNIEKDNFRVGKLLILREEEGVQHGLMEVLGITFPQPGSRCWKVGGNGFDLAQERLSGARAVLVNAARELKGPAFLVEGAADGTFKDPGLPGRLGLLAENAVPVASQFGPPAASGGIAPGKKGEPRQFPDGEADVTVLPIPIHRAKRIVFAIAP